MEVKLDLHVHSAASPDGRMSLQEIVKTARAAGLSGVAVCDHDRALTQAAAYPDFLLIPGIECSTEQGHLLGLFVKAPIAGGSFRQCVDAIHAQGGVAVLAHPFERSKDAERLKPLVPHLDGLEVWNGRADRKNKQANAMAREFAAGHGLRAFAGSDAHLPQEIGNGFVTVEVEELTLAAVKTALLRGPVRVAGRRGEARRVAASQLTKRKKTGAKPAAYAKWALFAAKCCAEDLFRTKGDRHVIDR